MPALRQKWTFDIPAVMCAVYRFTTPTNLPLVVRVQNLGEIGGMDEQPSKGTYFSFLQCLETLDGPNLYALPEIFDP